MGMYTECVLKCSMMQGEKLDLITRAFDGELVNFTGSERGSQIFKSNSFYHHPETIFSIVDGYLFARFDLKNYSNDIELFLEWISDAVDEYDGKCVGWYWYEEEDAPSFLVMKDGKIVIQN